MIAASGIASGPSRKANVLIVTTGLGIGGAETVVRDLALSVDRRRFNLSVCCLRALGEIGEELAREGVDVVVLPQPPDGRVDYLTTLGLRRVIRDRNIHLVHSHTTHALCDAGLCKMMLPGLKVVHTFHFGNYPHLGGRLLWMERIFARLADRLVAVGIEQRQQIREAFWLSDSRISVVWNGVQVLSPAVLHTFRSDVGAEGRVSTRPKRSSFCERRTRPTRWTAKRRPRSKGSSSEVIELPSYTLSIAWHQRTAHDSVHRWVREQVLAVAGPPAGHRRHE